MLQAGRGHYECRHCIRDAAEKAAGAFRRCRSAAEHKAIAELRAVEVVCVSWWYKYRGNGEMRSPRLSRCRTEDIYHTFTGGILSSCSAINRVCTDLRKAKADNVFRRNHHRIRAQEAHWCKTGDLLLWAQVWRKQKRPVKPTDLLYLF